MNTISLGNNRTETFLTFLNCYIDILWLNQNLFLQESFFILYDQFAWSKEIYGFCSELDLQFHILKYWRVQVEKCSFYGDLRVLAVCLCAFKSDQFTIASTMGPGIILVDCKPIIVFRVPCWRTVLMYMKPVWKSKYTKSSSKHNKVVASSRVLIQVHLVSIHAWVPHWSLIEFYLCSIDVRYWARITIMDSWQGIQ